MQDVSKYRDHFNKAKFTLINCIHVIPNVCSTKHHQICDDMSKVVPIQLKI